VTHGGRYKPRKPISLTCQGAAPPSRPPGPTPNTATRAAGRRRRARGIRGSPLRSAGGLARHERQPPRLAVVVECPPRSSVPVSRCPPMTGSDPATAYCAGPIRPVAPRLGSTSSKTDPVCR
jgi:hypothetical protein